VPDTILRARALGVGMERIETDAAQSRQAVAARGIAQFDDGAAQQCGATSYSAVFEKVSSIDFSFAHRSPIAVAKILSIALASNST
jgi:hypothetical protein